MSGFNFTKELLESERYKLSARYSYILRNPKCVTDPNEHITLTENISEINNAITVLEGHYEYLSQTPESDRR